MGMARSMDMCFYFLSLRGKQAGITGITHLTFSLLGCGNKGKHSGCQDELLFLLFLVFEGSFFKSLELVMWMDDESVQYGK